MTARIGLVGCGRWGSLILRDLLTLGCEVTVAAITEATASRARDGGAGRVVDSIDEFGALDGIVVATPTVTHAEVVDAALDCGVPVFVEKPMTADANSASRLAARAPDSLFVMDKWRYHAGVQELARIAASGEMGRVVGLRTTRMQAASPHDDVDPVWILAPHDISIALEILGEIPTPRAATADIEGEAFNSLIGVLGTDPWMVMEVGAGGSDYRREVRLVCADGSAVLDDGWADHVLLWPRGAAEPTPRAISSDMPLLGELTAFVAHLGGAPPPKTSAADGAAAVAAIEHLRNLADLGLPR